MDAQDYNSVHIAVPDIAIIHNSAMIYPATSQSPFICLFTMSVRKALASQEKANIIWRLEAVENNCDIYKELSFLIKIQLFSQYGKTGIKLKNILKNYFF